VAPSLQAVLSSTPSAAISISPPRRVGWQAAFSGLSLGSVLGGSGDGPVAGLRSAPYVHEPGSGELAVSYRPTVIPDRLLEPALNIGSRSTLHSVSAMPAHWHESIEEMRFAAYQPQRVPVEEFRRDRAGAAVESASDRVSDRAWVAGTRWGWGWGEPSSASTAGPYTRPHFSST